MHQIRIFIGKEDEPARLAKEVNDWLANDDVKLVNIFGNLSPQTTVDKGESRPMGAAGEGRRYAPSDIMLVVVFEQAKAR